MLMSGFFLVSLFVWPMWQIKLMAPQYPDGVTMYIYIDKIGGKTPGTLQNVNILNHYVGMKRIEPESIPELKILPIITYIFIGLALMFSFVNRSWGFLAWFILFGIICVIGMYDFYLWEYDYGHDLDPKAPLVIEGQYYQPPLIGTKTILNFKATSLPHIGGLMAMLSLITALLAWFLKRKQIISVA